MSHLLVLAILPDGIDINDRRAVDGALDSLLAPYDENFVCSPYLAPLDDLDIALGLQTAVTDGIIAEVSGADLPALEVIGEWSAWKAAVAEYKRQMLAAVGPRPAAHALAVVEERLVVANEQNEILRETTVNPDGMWDWWEIGGRWSGVLKLSFQSDQDSRRTGDIVLIGELPKELSMLPAAIVTPEHGWEEEGLGRERTAQSSQVSQPEEWTGLVEGRLDSLDRERIVVVVDCHR